MNWKSLTDGRLRHFSAVAMSVDIDSFRTYVHNRARYHNCKAQTRKSRLGGMWVRFVPKEDA